MPNQITFRKVPQPVSKMQPGQFGVIVEFPDWPALEGLLIMMTSKYDVEHDSNLIVFPHTGGWTYRTKGMIVDIYPSGAELTVVTG